MKKQDNESLIQEIQKRLDWYTMEASDEEFDADEVQNLLKLLDSLTPEEEKDRLSSDVVVDNFWKYCAEREEEERILAEADASEKRKSIRYCIISEAQGCCSGSGCIDCYHAGRLLADGGKCREAWRILLVDG